MTILDRANAFIGYKQEVDEGYVTGMRRRAFIAGFKEALGLVKEMREAQKIYAEMFPTGYECYAPTELESEVDELIKETGV